MQKSSKNMVIFLHMKPFRNKENGNPKLCLKKQGVSLGVPQLNSISQPLKHKFFVRFCAFE